MFWADRIADEILTTPAAKKASKDKPLIIRDEKTLSGRVHVGSMRGVAIHGLVAEVLKERGTPVKFLWEHNDFDDFDTVPGYLPEETYKKYLAAPLYKVPSPEPGFNNFAEYFAAEFVEAHKKASFHPEYYWAHKDLYGAGKMDACIMTALNRAADIRRILKDVSGSEKDASWLPIVLVCESCGRSKTTRPYDFDGETVGYTCDVPAYGATPCGHEGRIKPTGGRAKLFWKVDWAAKWSAMEVDVEGGGKDHSTKGGARDVANHISREIFDREPPFDIPYEFFLVGGKKMSSSKGRGSSAKDMSELFPSPVFRLALLGKEPMQQIDVDPSGDSVPRMYDWYDELAEHAGDDYARLFALLHEKLPSRLWRMRFSEVAFIVQMPHLSLIEEAARAKGSTLTKEELEALEERAQYARYWLSTYAPERHVYKLQDTMPSVSLSDTQKKALTLLREYLSGGERTGEELHARLHELKSEVPIEPKELFSALYRIFLNRDSGPKAGWFLSVLPHDFVRARLEEAAR